MSVSHEMLVYNAYDALATLTIWEALQEELKRDGYLTTHDFTTSLYGPLCFMQKRGLKINITGLEEEKKRVAKEIEEKQAELERLCGEPLNPNSPKQCIQYFYIKKGIAPYINRKTKKPTTDDTAMHRLAKGTSARKGLPEANLVQQIRGLRKLTGTYLEMEFDADGRLRCSYNPRGTVSGRLSSSKTIYGTGMNLQNQPEVMKQYIVPDDGCIFIELDKAGAEWVIVAYLANDANMIRVVEQELDPHTTTAELIFGVSQRLIREEAKVLGHTTNPDDIRSLREQHFPELLQLPFIVRNMSMRQAGKKGNHGLNYDEAYVTFALLNDLLETDAKRIINLYHDGYPGIRNHYYNNVKTQLGLDRTLINCFGRKRRFLDPWGDRLFKAAYAQIPQSTVVDMLNRGIVEGYNSEDEDLRRSEQLAQVHDSVLLQFPISDSCGIRFDWIASLARCIKKYDKHLSPTIEYSGREFQVRTTAKVSLLNWRDMSEVSISQDLTGLEEDLVNYVKANEQTGAN